MANHAGSGESVDDAVSRALFATAYVTQIEFHDTYAGHRFPIFVHRLKFPLAHRLFDLRVCDGESSDSLNAGHIAGRSNQNLIHERRLEVETAHESHAHVNFTGGT